MSNSSRLIRPSTADDPMNPSACNVIFGACRNEVSTLSSVMFPLAEITVIEFRASRLASVISPSELTVISVAAPPPGAPMNASVAMSTAPVPAGSV